MDALLAEAGRAHASGDLRRARQLVGRALVLAPRRADLMVARGHIELAGGDLAAAAGTSREVIERRGNVADAWKLLAGTLRSTDPGQAETAWRTALEIDPDDPETLFHLGKLHGERGEASLAAAAYRHALIKAPGNARVLMNLGVELDRLREREAAKSCYREILARHPAHIEALANLAELLFRGFDYASAAAAYADLVSAAPDAPAPVWNNFGVSLRQIGDREGARRSLARALRSAPSSPEVLANLGFLEYELAHWDAAKALLAHAQDLAPSRLQIHAQLLDIDLHFADWTDFAARRERLIAAVARIDETPGQAVTPFGFLSICDEPALQLAAARSFAWSSDSTGAPPTPQRSEALPRTALPRLGFVMGAFDETPETRAVIDLVERLDRSRFEIFAYALHGGGVESMRARVLRAVTACVEFGPGGHADGLLSTADIAARIGADGISILFDLAGYTLHARPEVFALRPAPTQISFIGHPGSLGARHYDYIVTDPYVAPESEARNYAETLLYVASCYFPSDPSRVADEPGPCRADYGLADEAFVFMSQADAYKILPSIFDVWMRLLADVDDSVLWLRPVRPIVEQNLRREAILRGVDPSRLIFAPREPFTTYLARYRLADLFLDTHPFGSLTTVNDALFAGLPVITIAGKSMAGRGSASQLRAVGCGELVANSHEEYEALALTLACDRSRLKRIRNELTAEGRRSPLFDMKSYARGFQAALDRILEAQMR